MPLPSLYRDTRATSDEESKGRSGVAQAASHPQSPSFSTHFAQTLTWTVPYRSVRRWHLLSPTMVCTLYYRPFCAGFPPLSPHCFGLFRCQPKNVTAWQRTVAQLMETPRRRRDVIYKFSAHAFAVVSVSLHLPQTRRALRVNKKFALDVCVCNEGHLITRIIYIIGLR